MACVSVKPAMDAAQALADLTEISSQIEAAALFGGDGEVGASTFADGERAQAFVRSARELLEAAGELRSSASPNQIEVATAEGSVFVVRDDGRLIAATTTPEPTVGLVFYDLKSCLRAAAAEEPKPAPKPKRRTRKKQEAEQEEPDGA
jgi:predicted regulator of Ras-like GTPase activity (Roadblock/LC7/MglB family)